MASKLSKVNYFYTTVSNTPGKAATILAGLADAGVNLVAFSGFPDGRHSQLDFVPEDSAKFLRAAKAMQLKVSKRKVGFLYRGDDKVEALTKCSPSLRRPRSMSLPSMPSPRRAASRHVLGEAQERQQHRRGSWARADAAAPASPVSKLGSDHV